MLNQKKELKKEDGINWDTDEHHGVASIWTDMALDIILQPL